MIIPQSIGNQVDEFAKFANNVHDALKFFDNYELARKRLHFYRWKVTEELDKNLLEFESGVKRTGGNVLWGNEVSDTIGFVKSFIELNPKVAFIPGRISNEISIAVQCNIPSLTKFRQENSDVFPDILIAQAKFLVSTSGHIFYCTENKEEFEAVSSAKHVIFLAGIDTMLNNGQDLELAKNLYSTYELGQFGYSMEILTKPGKPDNRFLQQISLIVVDHGRSNMLDNVLDRKFFPLLDFQLPTEVAKLFWKEKEGIDTNNVLQHYITNPMLNDSSKSKKFLFTNNGYNRLSEFFPLHIDIYDYFMQARLAYMSSSKTNFFINLTKVNYVKAFLEPKTKMNSKKFTLFIKEKLFGSKFKINALPEKTFIERHFYDKRKI